MEDDVDSPYGVDSDGDVDMERDVEDEEDEQEEDVMEVEVVDEDEEEEEEDNDKEPRTIGQGEMVNTSAHDNYTMVDDVRAPPVAAVMIHVWTKPVHEMYP